MPSRLLAAGAARFQFPTGVGTPLVDAAGYAVAHPTGQRSAAYGYMVGAAHAAGAAIDFYRQSVGYRAPGREQLVRGEVDPEARAAGAALSATVFHSCEPPKQKELHERLLHMQAVLRLVPDG